MQEHVQSTADALLTDRDKLAQLAKELTVQPVPSASVTSLQRSLLKQHSLQDLLEQRSFSC